MQQIELVAVCLLIGVALGQISNPVARVAIFESAMAPMLGAGIIAIDHDLKPDLVPHLIGVGVPVSILTVWGWWTVVGLA